LDIHIKNNPANIAMPLGNITGFNLKKRIKAVRQTRRGGFLCVLNDMTGRGLPRPQSGKQL